MKLIAKLKQIKAGEAIAKEKGSQASAGENWKINVPYNKNHTKGLVSHSPSTRTGGGRKITKKHKKRHYK